MCQGLKQMGRRTVGGLILPLVVAGSAFTSITSKVVTGHSAADRVHCARGYLNAEQQPDVLRSMKLTKGSVQRHSKAADCFTWLVRFTAAVSIFLSVSFTPLQAAYARGVHVHPEAKAKEVLLKKKLLKTSVVIAAATKDNCKKSIDSNGALGTE